METSSPNEEQTLAAVGLPQEIDWSLATALSFNISCVHNALCRCMCLLCSADVGGVDPFSDSEQEVTQLAATRREVAPYQPWPFHNRMRAVTIRLQYIYAIYCIRYICIDCVQLLRLSTSRSPDRLLEMSESSLTGPGLSKQYMIT